MLTIKDLKEAIKDLPDEMGVFVADGDMLWQEVEKIETVGARRYKSKAGWEFISRNSPEYFEAISKGNTEFLDFVEVLEVNSSSI